MIRIANRSEAERLLGIGLYTPSEAARYARVQTGLMTRWIHGTRQGKPVIEPQVPGFGDEDRIVTFLDFVQALAIRKIRNERHISLQKIREAYLTAKEDFRVDYPFALESTRIGLFGPPDRPDRQEVWLCVNKTNEEEVQNCFQITGKKRKNQLIAEVVRTYASRLVFDEISKLATKYYPFPITPTETGCGTGTSRRNRVVMEPGVRFGEPYIESCGYTAQALFDAYQSEGSIERAAENCGVTLEEITLAIEYIDYLEPKPQAA